MLLHLENEDFNEEVKEGVVLVDFFATWCGPCKMLGPVLEEIAKEQTDLKIVKVDVDQHESLAQQFGIMSVPTLVLYKDGRPVKQMSGFMPKDALLELIK